MKNELIVKKIIACADKIFVYCAEFTDNSDFESDTKTLEACVFNLSQIGELANKLDDEYKATHSDIPWRKLIAVRNRIIHDYEGLDHVLVWDIIKINLPELIKMLKGL
jgi:uncharacterized protein with HEPN domain